MNIGINFPVAQILVVKTLFKIIIIIIILFREWLRQVC